MELGIERAFCVECREAEERAAAEKRAAERAAAEKAAAEKAAAEQRMRSSAAVPVKASPASSGDDSGPPLYMPLQHRPGDHGAVPSVHPQLTCLIIHLTVNRCRP